MIGIVGRIRGAEERVVGIHAHYVDYFSERGPVVILPPMTKDQFSEFVPNLSVLVLPGGPDILTSRYNEMPGVMTQAADQYLEYFDKVNLPVALQQENLLVVGICRGFQSLMVHHGFALNQNIDGFHPKSATWYDDAHKVTVNQNRLTSKPFDRKVNSLHHQGVVLTQPAIDGLITDPNIGLLAVTKHNAYCSVVEAAEGPNWLGIQWHPEATGDLMVSRWIDFRLADKRMLTK